MRMDEDPVTQVFSPANFTPTSKRVSNFVRTKQEEQLKMFWSVVILDLNLALPTGWLLPTLSDTNSQIDQKVAISIQPNCMQLFVIMGLPKITHYPSLFSKNLHPQSYPAVKYNTWNISGHQRAKRAGCVRSSCSWKTAIVTDNSAISPQARFSMKFTSRASQCSTTSTKIYPNHKTGSAFHENFEKRQNLGYIPKGSPP